MCTSSNKENHEDFFSEKDHFIEQFNHKLHMNIVKMIHGNVLPVIERRTGYQNGSFLVKMDAEITWRTLGKYWLDAFAGTPDYICSDVGANFNSMEFRDPIKWKQWLASLLRKQTIASEKYNEVTTTWGRCMRNFATAFQKFARSKGYWWRLDLQIIPLIPKKEYARLLWCMVLIQSFLEVVCEAPWHDEPK